MKLGYKTCLLVLLLPALARAESFYLTVPGEAWSLKLDVPAITSIKGEGKDRYYKVTATSVPTGVTFSLYTETQAAGSNAECREKYWGLNKASPIQKQNIRLFGDDNFLYVSHTAEVDYKGQHYKTANGHAYFVKNGLCMDLHVSHYPLQEGSEQRVEAILRSATVVQ